MELFKKKRFTREQVRLRERLHVSMRYWFKNGLWVYWVTLTSSPDSVEEGKVLRKSWEKLIRQWRREYSDNLEFCCIETSEGLGVVHAFVVTDQRTPKCFEWLREKWSIYHRAGRVRINELSGKRGEDAEKVSWYAVTQYAVGQGSTIVKVRWSRFTFLPRPAREFCQMARSLLRSEVFCFTPWHCTYQMINDFAVAMVEGRIYELNGYKLMLGMSGKAEIFETPDRLFEKCC